METVLQATQPGKQGKSGLQVQACFLVNEND